MEKNIIDLSQNKWKSDRMWELSQKALRRILEKEREEHENRPDSKPMGNC